MARRVLPAWVPAASSSRLNERLGIMRRGHLAAAVASADRDHRGGTVPLPDRNRLMHHGPDRPLPGGRERPTGVTGIVRVRRALLAAAALVVAMSAAPGASAAGVPALDAAVRATLDEIDAHGFNPATGGLFINWSVDDPTRSNLPDGSPARRDELTDLRDLLNMTWYEHRHPGDGSQAAALARLAAPLRARAVHYSSDKGWVYWQ